MTLTDAAAGAAALWLLFSASSLLDSRTDRPSVVDGLAVTASTLDASHAVMPYSVWYEETPTPRHVTPPLPGGNAAALDVTHRPLGSVAIGAIWQPQVLSLTEVIVAPGGQFAPTELNGSGLIVLQSGQLELAELAGDARLVRSPHAMPPTPVEDNATPILSPGDRLAFGPGATIVLRNCGETPARIITASVLAGAGFTA